MNGVTVLNTWTETHVTFWLGGLLTIIFFAVFIVTFAFFVVGGILHKRWDAVGAGVASCIFLLFSTIISFYAIGEPKEVSIYEVAISDDVKFNEFMERYKVISQRGYIYVVEERIDLNV